MDSLPLRGLSIPETANICGYTAQTIRGLTKDLPPSEVIRSFKTFYFTPEGAKTFLTKRGHGFSKMVVAFWIIKGGVGKTSLAYAFARRMRMYGYSVLCIDIDQQGNLSRSFGIDPEEAEKRNSLIEWIRHAIPSIKKGEPAHGLESLIINGEYGVDIIPSKLTNSLLEKEIDLSGIPLEKIFAPEIRKLSKKYDCIVMDFPPALSKLTAAFVVAADRVIMPITPNKFSHDGLNITFSEIDAVSNLYDKKNIEINIVWNRFDVRKRLTFNAYDYIESSEKYKKLVAGTMFRECAILDSFVSDKKDIFSGKTSIKEDMDSFISEITNIDSLKKEVRS